MSYMDDIPLYMTGHAHLIALFINLKIAIHEIESLCNYSFIERLYFRIKKYKIQK